MRFFNLLDRFLNLTGIFGSDRHRRRVRLVQVAGEKVYSLQSVCGADGEACTAAGGGESLGPTIFSDIAGAARGALMASQKWVGQSLKRTEDPALLTGRGSFVGDPAFRTCATPRRRPRCSPTPSVTR